MRCRRLMETVVRLFHSLTIDSLTVWLNITPVTLLHTGWGVDRLATNFSQFVEAVEDIQTRTLGTNTPAKRKAEYIFDIFKLLESSIDDIDNAVEFVPFKMVGYLDRKSHFKANSHHCKGRLPILRF